MGKTEEVISWLGYIERHPIVLGYFAVGILFGAVVTFWLLRKYKIVNQDDVDLAKKVGRMESKIEHLTQAFTECTQDLHSYRELVDEDIRRKLKGVNK